MFAMNALGFDNYVEPLKIYLQKYREWVKQVIYVTLIGTLLLSYSSYNLWYFFRCTLVTPDMQYDNLLLEMLTAAY